uniref:Reverse transcriptase domain-containing protein n=1 Tax=Timema genevievae TaxID=629358 RepID=A0A7R9PIH2_TIMGE|nr:unnamed protein product [Timema genevievae]
MGLGRVIRICTDYANVLGIKKVEFRVSVPTFAWKKSGTVFRKKYLNTTNRDSNPDLPVFGCLVYCKSDALNHAAIETDTKLALYADDTALVAESWRGQLVERRIQTHLTQLEGWLTTRRKSINVERSTAVLFTWKRKNFAKRDDPSVRFRNHTEQYCFNPLSPHHHHTSHRDSHVAETSSCSTATHVAGTITLPTTSTHTAGTSTIPPHLGTSSCSTTTSVAGTFFCSTTTNVAGTLSQTFCYPYPHVSEHNVAVVATSNSYPRSRSEG